MGWAKLVLALVALQCCTTALFPDLAAAADPPSFPPLFNGGMCNGSVDCGRGTCGPSTKTAIGFECVCDPGWSQSELHMPVEDYWKFLPCVVPNCTMNYSCTNGSAFAASPLPPPPLTNLSLFDPCSYSFCGGGSCVKVSTFDRRCECKEGFSNLFNVSTFPCYNECSLGADCSNLGISLTNTSSSPPPPSGLSDQGNTSVALAGGNRAPNFLLVAFSAIVTLSMVRTS